MCLLIQPEGGRSCQKSKPTGFSIYCVPLGTSDHEAPKRGIPPASLLRLCRLSWVPLLLEELRSLFHRIRVVHEIQRELVSALPAVPAKSEPLLIPNTHKHVYIESMRRLESQLPFPTTWDRLLATRILSDLLRSMCHSCDTSQSPNKEYSSLDPERQFTACCLEIRLELRAELRRETSFDKKPILIFMRMGFSDLAKRSMRPRSGLWLAASRRRPAAHTAIARSIPRHDRSTHMTAWSISHVDDILHRIGGMVKTAINQIQRRLLRARKATVG